MKIFAAVPFPVNQGGALFLPKESGFHLINDSLSGLGNKTSVGQSYMMGLDAIPSGIAHVIKMHSDMKNRNLKERYNKERWRKVVTIFALSKYRAYDIAIDIISEKNCNPLIWETFGKKLVEETEMKDGIYLLQLQGIDVAFFDRKGYLLPVAQFPIEIENELGEDCIKGMDDYEKDILLTFLQGLLKDTLEYQYYIADFITSLKENGAKTVDVWNRKSVFEGECIFTESIYPINQAHKYFWDIPSLPLELPPVFHPKLVLAITERRAGKVSGFGKDCTFQFETSLAEGPLLFSGFLPLSADMVDFLENNNNVHLNKIFVDDKEFEKNHELLVKLEFTIEGMTVSLKKCYKEEDILYADSVPMITLFPYVDLPEECWKRYYLVLRRNEGSSDNDIKFLKKFKKIQGKNIDLAENSWLCSTEAGREEDRQSWYYSSKKSIPSFVKLCLSDFESKDAERNVIKKGGYLGCICVGKPEITRNREARTYLWALDMGTRNTITAWRDEQLQQISFQLARDQIYCSLLFGMGEMDRNFARECYAPFQEISGSFPTMVRIYKQGKENGGIKCYEHGCALFPDLELIEMLLDKDKNWDEAAILTDIKFGRNDAAHERALQIFLFNMLWLGSLECALNGADRLKVRISYPRTEIKERIEDTWKVVKEMMGEISNIKISDSYCSEAEANARYLQKVMRDDPSQVITPENIFGICDIGDGTSDFNLYLGTSDGEELPGRIQFSMRYAGGDILVDTIMKFSEKRPEHFSMLWNIPEDEGQRSQNPHHKMADNLIKTYNRLLLQGGKKNNDVVDNSGEDNTGSENRAVKAERINYGLKESRRNIILALIENVGLRKKLIMSPEEPIRDFVVALTFKYWNLFHVYGDMLKKFTPQAVSFKLFFYGGGRKALEFATGESLKRFTETKFGKDTMAYLSSQAGVEKESFSINLEGNNTQKTEVVEGMLENVDSDSIKKAYNSREEIDGYYLEKYNIELPAKKLDKKRMEQLLCGYQQYIQETKGKGYFELHTGEEVKSVYEAITIGEQGSKKRTELAENNCSLFKLSAENLWHEVTEDKDNPSCLWEVLFYTKMSNYLLMENIL